MPNSNNPYGFKPWDNGGKPIAPRKYVKGTATALYPGDVVMANSSGEVVVATTAARILGVAAEYKAAAATDILVYDDPNMVFEAQCSADFAATNVFNNCDIVANSADTTLLQSNHTINSSTFGTTASLQFKVIGLIAQAENAVGSYARIKVIPNTHEFKANVTGV